MSDEDGQLVPMGATFVEAEYVVRQVVEDGGVRWMETRELSDGSFVARRHRLDDRVLVPGDRVRR